MVPPVAQAVVLCAVLLLLAPQQEGMVHALWARRGADTWTPSIFEAAMAGMEEFWREHPEGRAERDAKYQEHRDAEQQRVLRQIRGGAQRAAAAGGGHDDSGGRSLQASSGVVTGSLSRLGLFFPSLDSLVPRSALNTTYYRYGSVSPPGTVDWRYTAAMTPVPAQLQCESCWAMAVADAISIMVNLQNGLGSLPQTVGPYAMSAPSFSSPAASQLSVQQIMDCTDGAAANACQGGWPEWALEYAELSTGLSNAASYPYLARPGTCKSQVLSVNWLTQLLNNLLGITKTSQITSWDRTPIMSVEHMKRAVAQQPVLTFMSAVSTDFQLYRGGVYGFNGTSNCTADLNHVVLIVGYGTDSVAGDYWIIKNTWGPDWGENGFARIAMVDGAGVCGITSAPGLFPVNLQTKMLQNPCTTMFPPPCGRGSCTAQWWGWTAIPRCTCPPGFVESFSNKGVATCVTADPCGQNPDPCGPGVCANHADGSYACTCPQGTAIGSTTTGAPTCIAGQGTGALTYTAIAGDTCNSVMSNYGLTADQFQQYNSFVDCSSVIPAGLVLAVGPNPAAAGCAAILITRYNPLRLGTGADTLNSMAAQAGVPVAALLQLNPTLDSSPPPNPGSPLPPGMQVCVAGYEAPVGGGASLAPLPCGQSYTVVAGGGRDQCSYIESVFGVSQDALLALNPGLDCSQPVLPPQTTVCVAARSVATLPTVNCTQQYFVKAGDNCPLIWNSVNLTASQFFLLNPGIQCDQYNLLVGQQVCVAGPEATSFDTAIPYTVAPRDTLALVAGMFQARCGFYATPLGICSASELADCTAPLVVGTDLLIPCQWPVGRSCGCPQTGVPVCGADGQWYPNYCSAVCNFATPANAYTNGGCSDLQLACSGHSCFGTPDWIELFFPDWCPWPTWWPISYSYWGTDVCSFYRGACWNCCTGSVGLVNQGYPSASWYDCYEDCKDHVNYGC